MARVAARASASAPAVVQPDRAARSRRAPEGTPLIYVVMCLLAGGAVMVYSASSGTTVVQGGDGMGFLTKYVVYAALGFVAMHWIARTPLDRVLRMTGPLLAVSMALLFAVKVPGLGVSVNGAQRWLGAGPLQFQPSEIAKLALVLYAARFLAERPRGLRTIKDLLPLGIVVISSVGLVLLQPDLGTALVIIFTMGAMLVAAGVPWPWIWTLGGCGAFLVSLYSLSAPYRRARLTTFLNPWDHAADAGFQSVQGQIAIGSGGVVGRGLGQSVQKIFYLPEAHTDFILAIIGEELGLLGIFGLIVLYGAFAWAGLRIAQQAKGRYAALLAGGLTSLVLCQASLNLFAVLGLAPLTGVPLPFISYGSTNLVVLLAATGLLINVARGGSVHLRAVTQGPDAQRSTADADDLRDRRRGDSRARGAGARGGRRAAG
ncbi:unannotated protein [freshwater metagenome]|uniref:peptidoglycan glycosyltransferase n=1 Tax=freshwater metagenome TaxID=449393 RepID=A0A6J7I705_9ZZZZ